MLSPHTSRAAPPHPALPAWKDKALWSGMHTQTKAGQALAERRRMLICSLIKARRLTQAGGAVRSQVPVPEHTGSGRHAHTASVNSRPGILPQAPQGAAPSPSHITLPIHLTAHPHPSAALISTLSL